MCAKIATRTFLSDLPDAILLENIEYNISLNNITSKTNVLGLDWKNWKEEELETIRPDCIVASDCFYDSNGT